MGNIITVLSNLGNIVLPFISQAEATYPGTGTGAQKQAWVVQEVTAVVTAYEPGVPSWLLGLVLPGVVNAAVTLWQKETASTSTAGK